MEKTRRFIEKILVNLESRRLVTPALREAGIGVHPNKSALFRLWRKCAQVSLAESRNKGSYELSMLLMNYVSVVDNYIDNHQSVLEQIGRDVKNHLPATKFLRFAIKSGGARLPSSRVRGIVTAANRFRNQSLDAIKVLRKLKGEHKIDQLLKYRNITSGGFGELIARIANDVHEVPPDLAQRIETTFRHKLLADQYVDDFIDLLEDYRGGVENIVVSELKNNGELGALKHNNIRGKNVTFSKFAELAPKSHRNLMVRLDGHLNAISDVAEGNRGIIGILTHEKTRIATASVNEI
ncbi:MAG: hypothetical protein ABIG96_02040 [Candidatus Micrarchaeota archaeon]